MGKGSEDYLLLLQLPFEGEMDDSRDESAREEWLEGCDHREIRLQDRGNTMEQVFLDWD